MSRSQQLLAGAFVGGLLIIGGLVAAPPQNGQRGPTGMLALRRFLEEMGIQVKDASKPPPVGSGSFFLPSDIREGQAVDEVLDWVEEGGRLVLAAPSSDTAVRLGIQRQRSRPTFPRGVRLAADCSALEGSAVEEIVVSSAAGPLRSTKSGAQSCFRQSGGSHLILISHGKGKVIVLGGPSILTNQFLRQKDNERLAYRLFAGFGPVVFGPPLDRSAFGVQSPWALLPDRAKAVLAGLAIALAIFAVVRGRRFGRPVVEQPVSPIAASQLVGATAGLYQSARAADFAGQYLRQGSARRIARKLGVPGNADLSTVAAAAGTALSGKGSSAGVLKGPPAADDAELIELARELEALEGEVERL
jgi:hypothetical protein